MRVEERTTGSQGGRRRQGALLLAAVVLLGGLAGCDRDSGAVPYAGDPEGRIVTAGATADELVTEGSTARRIAAVRLSPGLVERWFTAQERLEGLAAGDADVRRLLDDRDRAGRGRNAIAASTRHLESDPRVREAISGAGLSTEEFVLTALALHQALLATSPGAPAGLRSLAARNVRFVDEHAGLLERLAAPRAPRVLAYTDSVSLETPFIDTLGGYDAAPYDLSPYPVGYPGVDSMSLDSVSVAEPVAPLDSVPLPPVVAPPPLRDSVRPRPAPPSPSPRPRPDSARAPRRDSVPVRRDTATSPPPASPRPTPTPSLPAPAPVPTPTIPPAPPPIR